MQTRSEQLDRLRDRSAAYAAFAAAFGPPGPEVIGKLATPQGLEALREVCGLDADARIEVRIPGGQEALSQRYDELFGHTARGLVTCYETEYGADTLFRQTAELGDIGGFFAAFCLALQREVHERPDHIRCECEFMAFLAAKEWFALDHGDDEMLAPTRAAQRSFLRDHLGRFAPAFGTQLSRADPDGFYGAAGTLVRSFVERECRLLGVSAGPATLPLRDSDPGDAVPAGCGDTPGCSVGGCP